MSDLRYSLLRGGLVYRVSRLSGLTRVQHRLAPLVAIVLVLFIVVPMVMATARDGTLVGGVTVPLLHDYSIWARFVVAVPLLVLAAPMADERLWRAIKHLQGLVDATDRDRFEGVLAQMRRWRDAWLPELLLFAASVLASYVIPVLGLLDNVSDWRGNAGAVSFATVWLQWVAMPVIRFLTLLWFWRLALWIVLLFRFSRFNLDLHAAHPDGRGGLAFLGYAQTAFVVLPLVGGITLAGTLAMDVQYFGAELKSLRFIMGGYVVLGVVLMVAPLLLLVPRLAALKRNSLLAYGALGTDCSEGFELKWLGRARGGASPILEAGDSSALCDLIGVYATVSQMSTIPLQRFLLVQFAIASALPLVPVVLMRMPIKELLGKILSALA
ncbi:hypothetical protein MNR01_16235 [Lysobacter sp. S4-A87]|uniref:hypothetical protein n=1 Tax=Lysobacter sp. S4-A87 TaxID=2925843 RepID=UPI001F53D6BF|nr:hypothetical protein [Lysobacter sp. S4-A87]UNK49253.1 hypothetical protein MNR01_16235 [Lysobacter sp. S4-A87]